MKEIGERSCITKKSSLTAHTHNCLVVVVMIVAFVEQADHGA